MAESRLQILLSLRDQASQGLSAFERRLEGAGRQARVAGLALSAFGAVGIFAVRNLTGAALEQERAMNTLRAVVNNTGASFDGYQQRVEAVTAALQRKTNFGDEEQLRILTSMVPVLGSVEAALAALPAVLDAAESSGLGVAEVARSVSAALTGQTNTIESLKLKFDETQGPAERLEIIMRAVAGAAEANADPWVQFDKAVGDAKEALGEAMLPTVREALGLLRSLVERVKEVDPRLLELAGKASLVGIGFAAIVGPALLTIGFLPALVRGVQTLTGAFLLMRRAAFTAWLAASGPVGLAALAGLGVAEGLARLDIAAQGRTGVDLATGKTIHRKTPLEQLGDLIGSVESKFFSAGDSVSALAEAESLAADMGEDLAAALAGINGLMPTFSATTDVSTQSLQRLESQSDRAAMALFSMTGDIMRILPMVNQLMDEGMDAERAMRLTAQALGQELNRELEEFAETIDDGTQALGIMQRIGLNPLQGDFELMLKTLQDLEAGGDSALTALVRGLLEVAEVTRQVKEETRELFELYRGQPALVGTTSFFGGLGAIQQAFEAGGTPAEVRAARDAFFAEQVRDQ